MGSYWRLRDKHIVLNGIGNIHVVISEKNVEGFSTSKNLGIIFEYIDYLI